MINNDFSRTYTINGLPNNIINIGSNNGFSVSFFEEIHPHLIPIGGNVFSIFSRSFDNPLETPLDSSTVIKISDDFIKP